MLVFESASVGVMAVVLMLAAVLVVVGVYVQVIWPLTDWDFVNVSLEQYSSAATAIVAGVFLGGSAAGYWCISGNAWKKMPRPQPLVSKTASRNLR